MFVKVMRPFLGKEGVVEEGHILEVSNARAAELEGHGLVTPLVGAKQQSQKAADPMKPRRPGGQTGAATEPSSSLPARRLVKRTSRPRKRPARKS